MKMNLILTFAVLVFASCGSKTPQSNTARIKSDEAGAQQKPSFDTSAYANSTWRFTAKYPDSVQGDHGVSGNTTTIDKGQSAVAAYPGQVACDLVVKTAKHDRQALSLPGEDKLFNPCELISALLRSYPYSGQAQVTKTHPRGGQNTVYYDAKGNIMAFKFVGTQAGTLTMSINNTLEGGSKPTDSGDSH